MGAEWLVARPGFPIMIRATLVGPVIAESDRTVVVEGNHHFPSGDVRWEHLIDSPSTSRCFWEGKARDMSVVVGDGLNVDAAWVYPQPWPLARRITGHVAFWRGVAIARTGDAGSPDA